MTLAVELAIDCSKWEALGDLEAIAAKCLDAALEESDETPLDGAEVSFLFCDDARVHALNLQFRGKDRPTNVLSFPTPEPLESARVLGDIVLAYETIAREANEQQKSLADHSRHMIVHGFLHLLGFDHENEADAAEMEALEVRILGKLGVENPYCVNGESETDCNGRF